MLNVVKTPFKSGSTYYPAGTILEDPAGIALYVNKLRDGIIVLVDEHNLQLVADYLKHRRGVDDAHKILGNALSDEKTLEKVADDYVEKVMNAAKQYDITTDDKSIDDIVAEVKAKAAEAKANKKTEE